MASEADIRRMLIDALRPSLLEIVRQEMSRVSLLAAVPAVSEISSDASSETEDRQRELERHIGQRLAEVEVQLAAIKEEFSTARIQDLKRVERLAEVIDSLEQRLNIAGAALRHELLQLQPVDPSVSERVESGTGQGRRSLR